MVNEFKLTVVHCMRVDLPLDKKTGKSGLGHRAAGPPGRGAVAGRGPRADGLILFQEVVLWNQLKVESNREHPLNSSQCLKLTFGSGLPHDQEDENILVTKILFGLYIICVCMQV